MRKLAENNGSEVWIGDSLDSESPSAFGGKRFDTLIIDAPYSEKTHKGHDGGTGSANAARVRCYAENGPPTAEARYAANAKRNTISYAHWSPHHVWSFCDLWLPKIDGWCVTITDDELMREWSAGFKRHGLYVFAPLPLVEIGSRVRLTGDGPSGWTCWIVVARPRTSKFSKWGTLPGAYVCNSERRDSRIIGGKNFQAMRNIVRDYTRPGDTVFDGCLGGGTTLSAAIAEGRQCVGIERDPDTAQTTAGLLTGSTGSRGQIGLF